DLHPKMESNFSENQSSPMQELELLQSKLLLLIKKHQALKKENQLLRKTIASQTETLTNLNQKFDTIEQHVLLEQMGKKLLTEEDKKAMKKQITHVIKEIDKLLVSLND